MTTQAPPSSDVEKQEAFDIGFNIVGPLAMTFLKWVSATANREGVEHIFFLSRDCQLPNKAYHSVNTQLGSKISASYLFGSRLAWAPLIKQKDPKLSIDWIRKDLSKVSIQDSEIIAYLTQEDLFKYKKVALVDVGWNGSMRNWLEIITADRPDQPKILGLNLALAKKSIAGKQLSLVDENREFRKILPYASVIEKLFCADHGQVLGYQKTNNQGIRPVIDDISLCERAIVDNMHNGALEFINSSDAAAFTEQEMPLRGLFHFLRHPKTAQVNALRILRFSPFIEKERSNDHFIRKYGAKQILRLGLDPRRNNALWPWPQGCLRLAFPKIPAFIFDALHWKISVFKGIEKVLKLIRQRTPF